jgi:hypothetical protein
MRNRTKTSPTVEPPAFETRIRERAYEIYLARGAGDGSDVQDWLQAEHEIVQSVLLETSPDPGVLLVAAA